MDGRRNELEVVCAVVREDQEPILLVVDGVFDRMASSFEQHGRAVGLVAAQASTFARDLARARDDDVALALGQLNAELESLVVLLEDEHVLVDRRAERMAPHLIWTQGL